jgi:MinD-like ATPase involved in chromosome partitioning or flagellar assembly
MSTESMPTIVVAGVPNLAAALVASGQFPSVHDAPTASQLRRVITTAPVRDVPANQLVLICGDALDEDDQAITLPEFLRKVTAAGYRVIVVSVTAKGADLQRQNPRAQLLTLPLNLNVVLYAISTFGYVLEPVQNGHDEIAVHPLSSGFGASTPIGPQQPPTVAPAATSGWVPLTPEVPAVSMPASTPRPSDTPGLRTPGLPATPFQTSAQPAPASTPSAPPVQAPAPVQAPSLGGDWTPPGRRSLADMARGNEQTSQTGWATTPSAPTVATPVYQPFNQPGPAYGTGTPPATPSYPAFGGTPTTQPSPTGVPHAFGQGPVSRAGVVPASGRLQSRRGYVITISTSKGGTGKSSLTLNLAAFLGMRLRSQGKTVCVIDANTQQADSGKYLDVYRPNVTTIVNDPSLLTEERILNALAHKPEYNLSVLLGPATPDEANPMAISPRLYIEILELLKRHFDYILIDTAVAEKFHEMFSEFSLPKADFIIVPVTPNLQTLHNADNWLRAAVVAPRHEGGAGIDRNRIGIVLNRAEEGIDCSEDDVRAELPNWHFLGSIPETREWKRANNNNELVAPKNYAELNYAFAEILHAATREPILLENYSTVEQPKPGIFDRLRKRKGSR